MLICFLEGIKIDEKDRIVSLLKYLKEDLTTDELKKCYDIQVQAKELRVNRMLGYY